jgi:hypothetical protein
VTNKPFDDEPHALSRAQWAHCIPIIEAELEAGASPDVAALTAFNSMNPHDTRVGAMLALSRYALRSEDRNKFSWFQVAWAEVSGRPEAKQFADEIRYYLPPIDLISSNHA